MAGSMQAIELRRSIVFSGRLVGSCVAASMSESSTGRANRSLAVALEFSSSA